MDSITPTLVATLATADALDDLRVLLFSLALWNPVPPTVHLYTDSRLAEAVPSLGYPGRIVCRDALTRYSGLTRVQMERLPGAVFPNLWFDFMAEKLALLAWVFATEPDCAHSTGVLFCDADICFLGPLPSVPAGALAALSPHGIRPEDEARFGHYNGGFLWLSDPALVDSWHQACADSRFFEQSALEQVAEAAEQARPEGGLHSFPRQQNYGWWRMWQGTRHPAELQRTWGMDAAPVDGSSGILVEGAPLGSVHTHFFERRDEATVFFNRWVLSWLQSLKNSHPPAARLLAFLQGPPEL